MNDDVPIAPEMMLLPIEDVVLEQTLLLNEDAKKTLDALQARGLSTSEAKMEIGRALRGCQWEVRNQMPNRWPAVLQALRDGRTAAELFPGARCEDSGGTH